MSIKEIITKTLFLILILHIFHEEEWDQASANFQTLAFLFSTCEKNGTFSKKNDPFIHSQLYTTTLQHLFQAKEDMFWINMGYLLHKFLWGI